MKHSLISIYLRGGTFLDINLTSLVEHFLPWCQFFTVTDHSLISIQYYDGTLSALISIYYRDVTFSSLISICYRDGTFSSLISILTPPWWNNAYMTLISIYYRNGTFYHDGISALLPFWKFFSILILKTLMYHCDGTFSTLISIYYRDEQFQPSFSLLLRWSIWYMYLEIMISYSAETRFYLDINLIPCWNILYLPRCNVNVTSR